MSRPAARKKRFVVRRNSKGETELHVACIRNQPTKVENLLLQGHPVNIFDNLGWAPLHEACNHGHQKIVEMLLSTAGIDVDTPGGDDRVTPAMDAATNGHLDIVQMLLSRGAKVDKLDKQGDTLLEYLQGRIGLDESPSEKRHLAKLISLVEGQLATCNFVKPVRRQKQTGPKNRSELLKARRQTKLEKFKKSKSAADMHSDKSDGGRELDLESLETQNARVYHETIEKMGKSGKTLNVDRSVCTKIKKCQVRDLSIEPQKSSLITEDEFCVQEDWLDDDLQIFKKKSQKRSRFSSDDDSLAENSDSTANENEAALISDSDEEPRLIFADSDVLPKLDRGGSSRRSHVQHNRQETLFDTNFEIRRKNFVPKEKIHPANQNRSDHLEDDITATPFLDVTPSTSNSLPAKLSTKATKIVIKIDGKKFMVPVLEKDLENNVGWLAQQAACRYGANYGRRPTLRLLNADQVELCVQDTIGLFLTEELVADVLNWDLVPLHVKYEQICARNAQTAYANIKNILKLAGDSGEINAENCGLKGHAACNLFLTLQDTYRITTLNIRGNRLTLENCQELGKCLIFLIYLKHLNLRCTGLGNEHMAILVESMVTHEMQALQFVDFSFNFFDGSALINFDSLSKIAPNLQRVLIVGCDFIALEEFSKFFKSSFIF